MAEFSIESAALTIDSVVHDGIETSINSVTEGITVLPMNSANGLGFAGGNSWSGTSSVLYDDTTASTVNSDIYQSTSPVALSLAITKAAGGTVTLSGNIGITGTSVTFSKSEVPMTEITFIGDGQLGEA